MELLIVRHAPAGDPEDWKASGRRDAERPLTPEGDKKFRRAAKGVEELVEGLDVIAASPLLRAEQTAALLARRFPKARTTTLSSLSPEVREAGILRWIYQRPAGCRAAVVGHDLSLSRLVAALLGSEGGGFLRLKKGGCALISFEGSASPGAGKLEWLIQPDALKALGK